MEKGTNKQTKNSIQTLSILVRTELAKMYVQAFCVSTKYLPLISNVGFSAIFPPPATSWLSRYWVSVLSNAARYSMDLIHILVLHDVLNTDLSSLLA